jgi:hypothetical protein
MIDHHEATANGKPPPPLSCVSQGLDNIATWSNTNSADVSAYISLGISFFLCQFHMDKVSPVAHPAHSRTLAQSLTLALF